MARQTVLGGLLRIDGVDAARAARAILSVLPLDTFVDHAAFRMEVVAQPARFPRCRPRFSARSTGTEGEPRPMGSIERFAFYERAKQAYCVIATGERRFYGCFVFQKGVIPPD